MDFEKEVELGKPSTWTGPLSRASSRFSLEAEEYFERGMIEQAVFMLNRTALCTQLLISFTKKSDTPVFKAEQEYVKCMLKEARSVKKDGFSCSIRLPGEEQQAWGKGS